MIRKLRERFDGKRRSGDDRGLTLVELLIAMVLAITLGGVIVAAIVTSLNVAGATSDGLKSSVDIRLISAYLARDAQGAAGVDPKTAKPAAGTGVSVTAGDWGDCAQDGEMVARFTWIEYLTVTTERSLTVTYALDGSVMNRALCIDGVEDSVLPLGRNLSDASARCLPTPDCSGTPTEIELTFSGTNDRSPYTTTLSAALRSRGQDEPTVGNSSIVSLLALGDPATPAPCSNLTITNSRITIVGDAVVANECGPTSINPTPPNITHLDDGATSLTGNLSDPLAAIEKPSFACTGGTNPTPIGVAQSDPTVYPQAVTIGEGEIVDFDAGRYVFCNGLTIEDDATVTSSGGVLLYIASGTVTIADTASVELTAATSGPQQRILVWATGTQNVQIGTGAHITRLGGTVYAPKAQVQFTGGTGAVALNVGSVVAETIGVSNIPVLRVGPVPTIDIDPTVLPDAEAGVAYTQQMQVVGSGAAELVNPVWSANGLTPFTINSLTGEITGTPQCAVDLTPTIRVVDANGLAASRDYTLKATSPLRLTDPGAYVRGTVTLTATLVDTCGGPNTSVIIRYALSGADSNEDGEPDWVNLCTMQNSTNPATPGVYTCDWNTTSLTDGDTYDLQAVATLPNSTKSESAVVEGVTIDNHVPSVTLVRPSPTPLAGTVTLVANASDLESAVARVEFEYAYPVGSNNWLNICTKTQPANPEFQDIFKCDWDTTQLVGAQTISFDIRAIAVDLAGNAATDTESNLPVNNSGSSLSIASPGAYVRGTVNLQTNPYVPSPATVTSVRIQVRRATGGTWADICTDTTAPFGCSWNTTSLIDNEKYELRAFMLDSRNGPEFESATIETTVDNALVYGLDVQATNGSRFHCTVVVNNVCTTWGRIHNFSLGKIDIGKIDANHKIRTYDILTYTYNKPISASSVISGWSGADRTIWIRVRDKSVGGNYVNTNDTLDICSTWTSGATCSAVANLGYIKLFSGGADGGKTSIMEARISLSMSGGKSYVTVTVVGPKKLNDAKSITGTMVWIPSASVTDTLGNPASSTPVAEKISGSLPATDTDF